MKPTRVRPESFCPSCGSANTTMTDWAQARCKDCGGKVRVVEIEDEEAEA